MGTGLGAIMKGTVAKNDVRTNGSFRVIVVGGHTGDIEESKDLVLVLQEPGRKSLPILMGINGGGEVEETRLQSPDPAGEGDGGIVVSPLRQAVGVGQESL